MRPFIGFFALAILLTVSPLQADTITFESDLADEGAFDFSPTGAAVTVTDWGFDRLVVTGGSSPGQYDMDGTLELFLDGCVADAGPIITFGYTCTPTVASYMLIVGSIPGLGLSEQTLFVGNFIGGAEDGFPLPGTAFGDAVHGGGMASLSNPLRQALGFDPGSEWQFTFHLSDGADFMPPFNVDQVIASNAPASVVPEPALLVLLGTGVLACARRATLRR